MRLSLGAIDLRLVEVLGAHCRVLPVKRRRRSWEVMVAVAVGLAVAVMVSIGVGVLETSRFAKSTMGLFWQLGLASELGGFALLVSSSSIARGKPFGEVSEGDN